MVECLVGEAISAGSIFVKAYAYRQSEILNGVLCGLG